MVILDGRSGKGKGSLALTAPADDCFLFADLTGRGRREDLVAKDRSWNTWGVSLDGQTLWQWARSVGHFPAIADADGDGKDEVFVGFALIDDNGEVLFESDPQRLHLHRCPSRGHPDFVQRNALPRNVTSFGAFAALRAATRRCQSGI